MIGERLKEIRKLKNLTQDELAKRLDVSPQDISAIERGQYALSAEKLQRLAKALGVTVGEIMNQKPPPPDPDEEEIKALLRGIPSESDKKKLLGIIRAWRDIVDKEEAAKTEEGDSEGK